MYESDVDIYAVPKTAEDEEKFNTVSSGGSINLTEAQPTLSSIMIGLGWDVIGFEDRAPDLDASIFLLNKDDSTRSDEDFIYYNNLTALNKGIEHTGDNRTGAGDGDDETVFIDLKSIPFDVQKILFVISIYDPEATQHSFEDVRNVFFRVVDKDTNREIFRYLLDDELKTNNRATALRVGYLSRDGDKWSFKAQGDLVEGGLHRLATTYGMIVAG